MASKYSSLDAALDRLVVAEDEIDRLRARLDAADRLAEALHIIEDGGGLLGCDPPGRCQVTEGEGNHWCSARIADRALTEYEEARGG